MSDNKQIKGHLLSLLCVIAWGGAVGVVLVVGGMLLSSLNKRTVVLISKQGEN